jgi:hypothetical protein
MAKIRVSSTELVWIFHETLKSFDDCSPTTSIAIVPSRDVGWMAVMSARSRTHNPLCARRVEAVQKELREIYILRG